MAAGASEPLSTCTSPSGPSQKGPRGLWVDSIVDGRIPLRSNLWKTADYARAAMTGGIEDGGIDWDAARQAEAKLSRLSLYGFLGLLRPERDPQNQSRVIHLEDDPTPKPSIEAGDHSQTTS